MLKPVLVTGASSGIGEATALHLAHKGFKVWAGARRMDRLAALRGLAGGGVHPVAMDVADEGSVARAIETIAAAGDRLYGVVNNAGVSIVGPVEEVPINEWRRQFETNVFGLVNVIQAVLPQMRAAREGRIVNVSSVAGRVVAPFFGPYAASKHAVEGLSDALRRETAVHGVRVCVVRPGFINTDFGDQEQEALAAYADDGRPYARQIRAFKAWHAKGHPNAKPPHIVAEAIEHALTAARPHSRYTVPARYLGPIALRNLAPSAVVDRLMERVLGLRNAGP